MPVESSDHATIFRACRRYAYACCDHYSVYQRPEGPWAIHLPNQFVALVACVGSFYLSGGNAAQVLDQLARIEHLVPNLLPHTTCSVEQLCAMLPPTAWQEVVRQKHSLGPYILQGLPGDAGTPAALHLVLPGAQMGAAAEGMMGDLPQVWIEHAQAGAQDEAAAGAGPSYVLGTKTSVKVDLQLDSEALQVCGTIILHGQCLQLTEAADVRGATFKGAFGCNGMNPTVLYVGSSLGTSCRLQLRHNVVPKLNEACNCGAGARVYFSHPLHRHPFTYFPPISAHASYFTDAETHL